MSNRIVFIDSGVSDYQSIINGLDSGVEVVILNSDEDGLAQIAAKLQGLQAIDAIDIFSHGGPGSLILGGTVLNGENLAGYSATLAEIGSHLSDAGDILLYGCNVAEGEAGQAFIRQLADLSGADVAASTNVSGSVELGGDWQLEAQVGSIDNLSFEPEYGNLLGGIVIPGSAPGSENVITGSADNEFIYGDGYNDTINAGSGDDTIWEFWPTSDIINGEDGNDTIWDTSGYEGSQTTSYLNGGAGNDRFQYSSSSAGDTAFVTGGTDSDTYQLDPENKGLLIATDFEVGANGDVLDIYNLMYASNPNYQWGDPIDGFIRVYQRGTGATQETWLQWDRDGLAGANGWQDVIKLENAGVAVDPTSLTADNFSTNQLPPIGLSGSAPTVNDTLIKPLGSLIDQPFQFSLPSGLFSDADADPLTYSATLNGVALNYDPVTGIFSGIAPATAGLHAIEITATDPAGYTVTAFQSFLSYDPSQLGSSGPDVFFGTNGNDIYVGLEDHDQLYGFDGDDILVGDGSNGEFQDSDYIDGGLGNDILVAGDGGAMLYGDVGSDTLVGGAGDDNLDDTNYYDFPSTDHNIMIGGDGNDSMRFFGYGGSATAFGGAGSDTYWLEPRSTGDLAITDFAVGSGGDVLNIENLVNEHTANFGYSGNPFDQYNGYLRLNQINVGTSWLEYHDGSSWRKVAELQGVRARDLTVDNFVGLQPGDSIYVLDHAPTVTVLPEHQLAGVGIFYNYQIPSDAFVDADGDALNISVEAFDEFGNVVDLPSWLNFDSNTFSLSGTPSTGDLSGSPLSIRITASDGSSSVSSDMQLLVVVPAGTSSNDNITGSVGDDNILGLDGYDNIYGFGGNDVLYGNGDANNYYNAYDSIYGGDGDDTIYGSDNSYWYNTLQGENGNDVIIGGSGDDHIDGGQGEDRLYGGAGNDELRDTSGDSGVNVFVGGAGNDQIYYSGSSGGSGTATGGSGSDVYWLSGWYGGEFTVTDFQAGANGDVLQIGELLNSLYGYDGSANPFASGYLRLFQDGADTLLQRNYDPINYPGDYSWNWETVARLKNVAVEDFSQDNFGPRVDPAGGVTQGVNVTGTIGDDVIFGSVADDTIDGGGSQNYSEVLYGYAGNDTIVANGSNNGYSWAYVNVYGGLGNDTLSAGYSTYVEIQGEQGDDQISGGSGNDYLSGGSGSDLIVGNDGNDSISDYDDAGDDLTTMDGGNGDDSFSYVSYAGGSAEITGGAGSDIYRLSAGGNGVIKSLDFAAGAGGDVLNLESLLSVSGWTELQGNPFASGTYNYLRLVDDGLGGTALEWDRDGSASVYSWTQTIDLVNVAWNNGNHGLTIDNFAPKAQPDGSSGGINLTGTPYVDGNHTGGDNLYGSIGDDVIDGAGGYYDTIYGYGGDDQLFADRYGATPANTYSWYNLYGGSGNDQLWAGSRGASMSGEAGNDVLHGSEQRDYLYGGYGSDTIYAGGGDDYINENTQYAGEHDVVFAGDGNDQLNFYGPGTATVTGGSGADTYTLNSYSGLLTITDFEGYLAGNGGPSTATGDVLNIDNLLRSSFGYSSGDPFAAGYLDWVAGPGYIDLQWDQDGASGSAIAKSMVRLLGVQETDLAPGNYAPTIDGITVRSITVTDGYVAGADIYFDTDGDGIADPTEYSGQKTDANGNFSFTSTHTETIIAVGGVNIDTGLPNLMTLKAPNGASTVNPLTTLVQSLVEGGAALADASQAVSSVLGLPPGVDVLSYDPLAQPAGDAQALAVQKTIVQVAAIAVLSGNPDDALDALANSIETNNNAGQTLDLTNGTDLAEILGETVSQETLAQIAGANQQFEDATDLTNLSDLQGDQLGSGPNAAPELTGEPASLADVVEDQQDYVILEEDLLVGWSDPNGNTISVTGLVANNGSLIDHNDGTWTFKPSADFNGTVTLSYQVTDGALASAASLDVTVIPVNDAPVNNLPGDLNVDANAVLNVAGLNVDDVDGNLASVRLSVVNGSLGVTLSGDAVIVDGDNGSASLTIGGSQAAINATLASLTYQSSTEGSDTLTIESFDSGELISIDTDTLQIVVNPVDETNVAPVASDAEFYIDEDTSLGGQLPGAFDEDGDEVIYSLETGAAHGSVEVLADGSYSYHPDENFNGDDSFQFTVSDNRGGSNTYTFAVGVLPVNDDPTGSATAVLASGVEDVELGIALVDLLQGFEDVDGDELSIANLAVDHGSLVETPDGNVLFTPDADFNGTVTLQYEVVDGQGGSVAATQSFMVESVDDKPVLAIDGDASIDEGGSYVLTLAAHDVDSVNLSYSIDWGDGSELQQLSAAELAELGGQVSHVFADDEDGLVNASDYTINVSVDDGDGETDSASLLVTVNNVAPTIEISGADHVNEDAVYTLSLGSVVDPGTDTVGNYTVDWGDGNVNQYTADEVANLSGNLTHVYADGLVHRTINVGLTDEDGEFEALASHGVDVYGLVKLGNAPTTLTSSTANAWVNAWTQPGVEIAHKANDANAAEVWSNVTKNSLASSVLSGGDIFAGDLGVSGQSRATSSVKQEIDGSEVLRFKLSYVAEEATINLSRFFKSDDGSVYSESGRLQAFNGDRLVGELSFTADNAGGGKTISLASELGFDSLVLTAGAYNNGQFVYGAYANSDGSFGAAPYTAGSAHGSDFLVDLVVIGVQPPELA